jgi:hypothetical protein
MSQRSTALPVALHFTDLFFFSGVSPTAHAYALLRSAEMMQIMQRCDINDTS